MNRRAKLAALLCALAFLGVPATAQAAGSVKAWLPGDGVNYVNGTISLAAQCESPTAEVRLLVGGTQVSAVRLADGQQQLRLPPYRLGAKTTLRVIGVDSNGATVGEHSVVLDPALYRPLKPVLSNTPASKVVPKTWTFQGAARRPVTAIEARVQQTGKLTRYPQVIEPTGRFTFKVTMSQGPATREIVAVNGFGRSPVKIRRVFYLGTGLPKKTRYIYISKKTLWAHHVYKGQVIKRWPVAIGTSRTPTPSGTFRIGKQQKMNKRGVWGALRRPLSKLKGGKWVRTRYYIHGTNEPWSIGMKASHGCVRMSNSHIKQFEKTVPDKTVVKIR